MKCIVIKTCWPDSTTIWKPGQEVEVDAARYALLSDFLKPVAKKRVIEKVTKPEVRDGSKY